jgi:hypothetical protein
MRYSRAAPVSLLMMAPMKWSVASSLSAKFQLVYRKCVTDGWGYVHCGGDQPWHECIGYCAVDHVHHARPELAPGDGLGLGWFCIVAAGRACCDNWYQGFVKFVNNIFNHGRCW